jgi:hypothetical protein
VNFHDVLPVLNQELQRFVSCITLTKRGGDVARPEIWIGTIEISWSDEKTPTVFQPVFTVVTTWAMLESYGWKLLDVERANSVPEAGEFSEEVEDMLGRTRNNPNAIIYSTFHSYPVM